MRPCLGMSCGSGQDLLDNFMLGQHDTLVLFVIPDVQESYTLREHLVKIMGFIKYDLSLAALGISTDHMQDRTRLLVEWCIYVMPLINLWFLGSTECMFLLESDCRQPRGGGGGQSWQVVLVYSNVHPATGKPFGNRPLTFLSFRAIAVVWWQLGKFLILAECIKHMDPPLALLLICIFIRKLALRIEEWTCHHRQTSEACPQALMEDGTHVHKSWWHVDSWPWPLLCWCCLLRSFYLMHYMTNHRDGNRQAC